MKYKMNGFYNVDCMDLMKEIPDKYFDLAIVDPPYGIGEDYFRMATERLEAHKSQLRLF